MKRLLPLVCLLLLLGTASAGPTSISSAYSNLTSAERFLVLRYFWQVPQVFRASSFAQDESAGQYPQLVGQDDQRDAYRHSLWNGSMTRRLKSKSAAERWGNAHEEVPGNPASRKAMDLSNNRTGRDLVWAARTQSGPWWWRRTRFPGDPEIARTMQDAVNQGGLKMVEVVGGQRDPQNGALVPTTTP